MLKLDRVDVSYNGQLRRYEVVHIFDNGTKSSAHYIYKEKFEDEVFMKNWLTSYLPRTLRAMELG
jgi:hypothetical protein